LEKSIDPIELSEELLLAVKLKKATTPLEAGLKNLSLSSLKEALQDDDRKKAFWINSYNAYFQIIRSEGTQKPDIYRKRLIHIAGYVFSLDDIEHGILRRNRYKYSMGYLKNIFAKRMIKSLSVDRLDYRIHFALNCGAKSCPPIAFYKHSLLDKQLNLATQSFLEAETIIDEQEATVHVTALFKWFAGDFGGKKGIVNIYKNQLDVDISKLEIKYSAYSWEEDLYNFSKT